MLLKTEPLELHRTLKEGIDGIYHRHGSIHRLDLRLYIYARGVITTATTSEVSVSNSHLENPHLLKCVFVSRRQAILV